MDDFQWGMLFGIALTATCAVVVAVNVASGASGTYSARTEPAAPDSPECDCPKCSARRYNASPAAVKRGAALAMRRALIAYDSAERAESEERASVERARAVVNATDDTTGA